MTVFRAVLDTTFFVLHYFSDDSEVQSKSREILRMCRILGNRGILPTIVMAEFYVQVAKRVGRQEARKLFNELNNADLDIVDMDAVIAELAGRLRHKYQEKIPWGDCIVAASALNNKTGIVISEDPHFSKINEIKMRKLASIHL